MNSVVPIHADAKAEFRGRDSHGARKCPDSHARCVLPSMPCDSFRNLPSKPTSLALLAREARTPPGNFKIPPNCSEEGPPNLPSNNNKNLQATKKGGRKPWVKVAEGIGGIRRGSTDPRDTPPGSRTEKENGFERGRELMHRGGRAGHMRRRDTGREGCVRAASDSGSGAAAASGAGPAGTPRPGS